MKEFMQIPVIKKEKYAPAQSIMRCFEPHEHIVGLTIEICLKTHFHILFLVILLTT